MITLNKNFHLTLAQPRGSLHLTVSDAGQGILLPLHRFALFPKRFGFLTLHFFAEREIDSLHQSESWSFLLNDEN
jgi:hypothetical protein